MLVWSSLALSVEWARDPMSRAAWAAMGQESSLADLSANDQRKPCMLGSFVTNRTQETVRREQDDTSFRKHVRRLGAERIFCAGTRSKCLRFGGAGVQNHAGEIVSVRFRRDAHIPCESRPRKSHWLASRLEPSARKAARRFACTVLYCVRSTVHTVYRTYCTCTVYAVTVSTQFLACSPEFTFLWRAYNVVFFSQFVLARRRVRHSGTRE